MFQSGSCFCCFCSCCCCVSCPYIIGMQILLLCHSLFGPVHTGKAGKRAGRTSVLSSCPSLSFPLSPFSLFVAFYVPIRALGACLGPPAARSFALSHLMIVIIKQCCSLVLQRVENTTHFAGLCHKQTKAAQGNAMGWDGGGTTD